MTNEEVTRIHDAIQVEKKAIKEAAIILCGDNQAQAILDLTLYKEKKEAADRYVQASNQRMYDDLKARYNTLAAEKQQAEAKLKLLQVATGNINF